MMPMPAPSVYFANCLPYYPPSYGAAANPLSYSPASFCSTTEVVPYRSFSTEHPPLVVPPTRPSASGLATGRFHSATSFYSVPTATTCSFCTSGDDTSPSKTPPSRKDNGDGQSVENGKLPCQFYLRTGTCAFGNRCLVACKRTNIHY